MSNVSKVLASIEPPPNPLVSTWEVSAVGLIRRGYDVPSVAGKALGQLDRLGAIRIGPQYIGFDADDVEWDKITLIRTRRLSVVLTESALNREVGRVRKALPPVPGRKWALDKLSSTLGDLSRVALDRAGAESLDRVVVSELEYRGGLGRRRSLSGGFVVAAVLGLIPEANQLVLDTAQHRGGASVEHCDT